MLTTSSVKGLQQVGYTIVEVAISIAICGLVLGGSYYAINREVLGIVDQQEHDQAIQLVESQIEDLKTYTGSDSLSSILCFSYTPPPTAGTGGGSITPITVDSEAQGSNPCIVQSDGSMASANDASAFTLAISPVSGSGASSTYQFSASWASVYGGQAQEIMDFRPQ